MQAHADNQAQAAVGCLEGMVAQHTVHLASLAVSPLALVFFYF